MRRGDAGGRFRPVMPQSSVGRNLSRRGWNAPPPLGPLSRLSRYAMRSGLVIPRWNPALCIGLGSAAEGHGDIVLDAVVDLSQVHVARLDWGSTVRKIRPRDDRVAGLVDVVADALVRSSTCEMPHGQESRDPKPGERAAFKRETLPIMPRSARADARTSFGVALSPRAPRTAEGHRLLGSLPGLPAAGKCAGSRGPAAHRRRPSRQLCAARCDCAHSRYSPSSG